jgi:EAL domain-containing protein (putative c-di-GMP-specific phosphodiesterase class I)/AmiR/NasT family two-component response regulator
MLALGQLRVLIVEERPDYRQKLRRMLTKIGCLHIDEALDGQTGLNALQNSSEVTDLVVCNLDMGRMDGLEFIRHATRLGVGGLILFSRHDDAVRSSVEWMARAYKAPLLGVLGVPFDRGALSQLISHVHSNHTVYSDVTGDKSGSDDANREAIAEIRKALHQRQFVAHYQPKVCLATGELLGVEALARWVHPELGVLAPIHFISLMESSGLIEPLTHMLLEQAGFDSLVWAKRGLNVPIAVNVSPLTLEGPECAKQLLDTIASTGLEPSQIAFEITEKAFARDATTVLENVLRLRMRGCGIAVDDFGTGYSSLQQLNRSPITELKLDRSFVRRILKNSKARSIIESTIDLATKLKLKTVAEGIDSEAQRERLLELGCHMGQGYLFGKAMPSNELHSWWRERRRIAA